MRPTALVLLTAAAIPPTVVDPPLRAQVANRLASSDSAQAFPDDDSARPHLDASGRFVVFQSDATNLVANDTNGRRDVFLKDFGTGLTSLVSSGLGGTPANHDSSEPRLSSDGRYVVFTSRASNLVLNDQNGQVPDVFVHDRQLGTTALVSRNHLGVAGNGASSWGSISDDGRYVVFQSDATGMIPGGDGNGVRDVYLRDLVTGIVTLVSHDGAGNPGNGPSRFGRITRGGQLVFFASAASDLVAGDTNSRTDIFAWDRLSGTVTRCSLGPGATEADGNSAFPEPTGFGAEVVYQSFATNLVANDSNGRIDVFASTSNGASTLRVSTASGGAQGSGDSLLPHVSSDGRYVAFVTRADDLFPGAAAGIDEIAVRDRVAGTTTRASVSLLGGAPNGDCNWPAISDDGRYVSYVSPAPNLIFGMTTIQDNAIRADIDPPVVASSQPFGAGCAGSQGVAAFGAATGSRPWLGTTFWFAGSNAPPSSFGVVIVGFSNTTYAGSPLPRSLAAFGMPGCDLLVAIDLNTLVLTDAAGDFTMPLAIPSDTSWRGATLHAQTWLVDPPANSLGAIVTGGLSFTIGG